MDTSFLRNKLIFITVVAVAAVVSTALTALLLGANLTELGITLGAGAVVAAIVAGTYAVGRRYGHPHSHAVAEASIAFGVLYLIAVTYRLLTEFGERSQTEVLTAMAAGLVATIAVIALTVALGRYGPSAS